MVLRGGAIGDFILTLPVLAALRRHFPRSRLELLGYPHIAELARAGGLVDEVRNLESPSLTGLFHPAGILDAGWLEYFRGVTLIISYLYDPENMVLKNLARLCSARRLQGRHRPDESQDRHAVDVLLEPLAELGLRDAPREPRLELGFAGSDLLATFKRNNQVASSNAITDRWLVLHPGSGSEKKNWPEAAWKTLLHRLWKDSEMQVLLVGGEAEGDRLERLVQGGPGNRVRLAQNLPLVELAGAMQRCAGFIGHDSGITHLAAALGLPGVVLWGHSKAQVWRPLSPRMTLLQAPGGLTDLTVDQVFANIRRAWVGGGGLEDSMKTDS